MITLDYLTDNSDEIPQPDQYQEISESSMIMDLMLARLVLVVNGIDLAWKGPVPLLDVVRQLSFSIDQLSREAPFQVCNLLDYQETITMRLLVSGEAELFSEYTLGKTVCDLADLRHSITRFGLKVVGAVCERYPHARWSDALRSFLPPRFHPARH